MFRFGHVECEVLLGRDFVAVVGSVGLGFRNETWAGITYL